MTLYTGSNSAPVETTHYDNEGNVAQQSDGNGDVTASSYDPLLRLVAETNPVSGTTVYTYNATEQTAVQDPMGNVTTEQYDAAGRLITATAPISGVTLYQYDAAGNTTVITNADTHLTPIQIDTRQYDALNRVITDTLSGPGGSTLTTSTRYDHDGNTYQVVRPAGDAVVNTYDLADELVSTEVDPQAVLAATHQTQSTFGYDGAGNQTQATDYGGDTTTSLYDGDSRLIRSVAVTGTSTLTTTNGYDPDGNVLTATLQLALPGSPIQTNVDTAAYNAADWQTSLADNGLTTNYGYDAAGRLRTRSTDNGQIVDTLDPEGRTTAISAPTAGTSSYGYNQDDQPITLTLPDAISGSMAYDKDTRLTGWSLSGPNTGVPTSTVNLQYGYGYDAANRTTGITVTDNSVSSVRPITHDAAGRITGWVGPNPTGLETWGYNSDGNIISTTMLIAGAVRTTVFTYSATQPNELVQQHTDGFGVATYTRDSYGNMTSETSTDPPSSPLYVHKTFGYDALERPISSTNVQNGATITATLGYNALSERITYTAVMSGQVVDSEHFAYNADGSLARTVATTATLNQNGTIKSSGAYTDTYAYDPQGAPLYLLRQQNGTTNVYTYLTDGHGNVTGLADSAGHRVNMDDYNPFGAPVGVGIQETVPQNFRLFGLWGDNELGQNFVGNRYEDVVSGFDQPDTSAGYRDYVFEGDDSVDMSGIAADLIGGATGFGPSVSARAGGLPPSGSVIGAMPFEGGGACEDVIGANGGVTPQCAGGSNDCCGTPNPNGGGGGSEGGGSEETPPQPNEGQPRSSTLRYFEQLSEGDQAEISSDFVQDAWYKPENLSQDEAVARHYIIHVVDKGLAEQISPTQYTEDALRFFDENYYKIEDPFDPNVLAQPLLDGSGRVGRFYATGGEGGLYVRVGGIWKPVYFVYAPDLR